MTARPRSFVILSALAWTAGAMLMLSACDAEEGGPVVISAIGGPARMPNPVRDPLDSPSVWLLQTTAQGLVRFDGSGQIVPALAQRWIVSDDGLRYTFRLARAEWSDGTKVTAAQVVQRLNANSSPGSRNRLKPLLGAIDEIVAMTDDVLEFSLKSPRPNFLQLLAQPEMAIVRSGHGTGPYRATPRADGSLSIELPKSSDEEEPHGVAELRLRGEPAHLAVARFRAGGAHIVSGGTAGDLLVARAARLPAGVLRFDPVAGLLGIRFAATKGPLADPTVRDALSKAIDRVALLGDLRVPGLQARTSLIPAGTDEVPAPALPAWSFQPQDVRSQEAADTLAASAAGTPIRLRMAIPAGPGYRVIAARLRRDWRAVGVDMNVVGPGAPFDLRLVEEIAPTTMASWYLRHFTCAASSICSPDADLAMEAARNAPTRAIRREKLAEADRLLRDLTPFIAITAPVRWSLVSPRLTGFQPNVFALHDASELIAPRR